MNSLCFYNIVELWKCYFLQKNPAKNYFKFRDGSKIYLSSNKLDSTTVVVIFLKKEYGNVYPDDIVVDIGANIGAFSIYAAQNGAKKVFSFEPNRESYLTLMKNIVENNLQSIIVPFNLAVTDISDEIVQISSKSSPLNKIFKEKQDNHCVNVKSISISDIIKQNNLHKINLLKLDCEGAEHLIFSSISSEELDIIQCIRMELHGEISSKEKLVNKLKKYFVVEKKSDMIYWFNKI